MTRIFNDSNGATTARRQQVLREARGTYTESVPMGYASATGVPTLGTVYYCLTPFLAGDLFSSTRMVVNGGGQGVGLVLTKVGLYTVTTPSTGTLVASSVDVSAAFLSAGEKIVTMQTPYIIPADGVYWQAFLTIAGATTAPSLIRSGIAGVSVGSLGAIVAGSQTGQSDLPASCVVVSASNFMYIMEVTG